MSEASSYDHDYHGHPTTRYYADPGEHPSSSVHRNRYSTGTRRVRDVSWISQQSPSPTNDPYARWHPPPSDPVDFPTPVFPDQPLPMAQSSPMMGRAPSSGMRMPSPMIGEYMTVEDPEYDEEELPEDNEEEIDFDFSNAPQHHTDGLKGARRWVGGFVKGLRKFPGLRKPPHRPSPSNDFVPPSHGVHHDDDVQFPTIASLRLRPLTPTGIAQTAELMNMPQPQSYPQPSPQHHAYQQQPHVHRPPPPAASSPVYAPGADVVPQVLSTVDERSSEQTGTHETHPHPHFSADHAHSPRTHTYVQPQRSHSRSHSNSHSHSRSHSNSHSQSHSLTVQPVHPNTTFTVTDYVTVPSPQQFAPPRPTPIKRFLNNLDQLPWIEHEQIVDAYFPGRSSRHRRHPESPVYEGKKPVASWYNKRQNSLPQGMGVGPSSASLLYGWPPQMQKAYSHQGMVYPQFPNGYAPAQPAFVYPATAFSLPPRMY